MPQVLPAVSILLAVALFGFLLSIFYNMGEEPVEGQATHASVQKQLYTVTFDKMSHVLSISGPDGYLTFSVYDSNDKEIRDIVVVLTNGRAEARLPFDPTLVVYSDRRGNIEQNIV